MEGCSLLPTTRSPRTVFHHPAERRRRPNWRETKPEVQPHPRDAVTMATVDEVRDWLRTDDPAWLNRGAIDDIKSKLEPPADPSIWHQPIEVAEINGRIHVFNGHHRLTAAVEAGYTGQIPVTRIPPPKDFTIGDHFGPFGDGN
jgi:hypothetical protein